MLVEERALLSSLELRHGSEFARVLEVASSLDLLASGALLLDSSLGLRDLGLLLGGLLVEALSHGLISTALIIFRFSLLFLSSADFSGLRRHTCILEILSWRATSALLGASAHHAAVLAGCEACEEGADVSAGSKGVKNSGRFCGHKFTVGPVTAL